jgi:predicted transcriptional regulator of viral defense system
MEVILMTKQSQVEAFLNDAGDIVTSKQVTEAGFHRSILSELVKKNELVQVSRGIYLKPTAWEDEMFFLQYRFGKGVFSHETALYLHNMTDRTPAKFTMTFPWGYNVLSLDDENLTVKRAVKKLYEIGIISLPSPAGNIIKAYDIERTLCDIVRGNNACEISVVNQAMKSYVLSKGKDIQKLMHYAKKLRVKAKILNYMEVLL